MVKKHPSLVHQQPPTKKKKALWGGHTDQSLSHFSVGRERFPPLFFKVFGAQKWSAAKANVFLNALPPAIGLAIEKSAFELWKGDHRDAFPLSLWQSGSGTQTHINVNEVIARLANQKLSSRHKIPPHLKQKVKNSPQDSEEDGIFLESPLESDSIHPLDHVNASQSSNDTVPTVIHATLAWETHRGLMPALRRFLSLLEQKASQFSTILKMGRTHLQDAVPITVGEEFSGFVYQIKQASQQIYYHYKSLFFVPQGGTAVGSGIGAPENFSEIFLEHFNALLGPVLKTPFQKASNFFGALSAHEGLLGFSSSLNTLATALFKIAQDARWLASGPRCGLGEWDIPANEVGSSLMPGKVNPTQAESASMVMIHVMSLHQGVSMACAQGNLQLNTYKPLIFHHIFQSLVLLKDSMDSLGQFLVKDLRLHENKLKQFVKGAWGLAPLFNPILGYEKVAQIVKNAQEKGLPFLNALQSQGGLSKASIQSILRKAKVKTPEDFFKEL